MAGDWRPQKSERSLWSCSYSGQWPLRVENAAACTAARVAERCTAVSAATASQGGSARRDVSHGSMRARLEPRSAHLNTPRVSYTCTPCSLIAAHACNTCRRCENATRGLQSRATGGQRGEGAHLQKVESRPVATLDSRASQQGQYTSCSSRSTARSSLAARSDARRGFISGATLLAPTAC